jgi:hypothetical protein
MVRRRELGLGLLSLAWGCEHRAPRGPLLLRGFRLVDVAARTVRRGDVLLARGRVVAPGAATPVSTIEGAGRFLLPALWDVKASLWGNDSAFDFDVLQQEMSFTNSLRVQLYYGVAHVAVFGMASEWAGREVKRAEALEMPAAEPLYPDRALGGSKSFACSPVTDAASLEHELQARKRRGSPFVHLAYGALPAEYLPSLSLPLLGRALARAEALGLRSMVLVYEWQRAAEAVEAGARLLYGLPEGLVPDSLVERLQARGVAFAPALARFFELDRLLGNGTALSDPFLLPTAMPSVLDSLRDPKQLWAEWRQSLERGRRLKEGALASVRALAAAGVPLLAASDAGWVAGTFQGYSSHAAQSWLERAGASPWARLAAATSAAAAAFGRSDVGFEPGHAADFLALDADPVERAENLRRIALVVRRGDVVDRRGLLPDLTRNTFKP